MVSILEHHPAPMSTLAPLTPALLDRIVAICLAKVPGDRWQSARDLTLQLEGIAALPAAAAAPRRLVRERIAWALPAFGALALIASAVAYYRVPAFESPSLVFPIPMPATSVSRVPMDPFTAVSPDGRHIAFTVRTKGDDAGRLWVRSLDSSEARVLPGTEDAFIPFWSPDSREIGFFTFDEQLKAVAAGGGPVRVLCRVAAPLGGTWNHDGVVLFSTAARSAYSAASIAGTRQLGVGCEPVGKVRPLSASSARALSADGKKNGRRFRRPFVFRWECLLTTPGGVLHVRTSRPRPYGVAPDSGTDRSAFIYAPSQHAARPTPQR